MADIPAYGELSARDYAEMGLMGGLEVHRQLATERKLFCRCPARRLTDEYHAEVLRHMRPTLSELGEYDGTALMEFKTRKDIVYRINRDNVCTYELDDAPPFELNQQALEYALEICLMFGCSIVGEVHIARKQYLDGSIPTGFQRTAIVGLDGAIPFPGQPGRVVRVQQISLEEDSCREVSDRGHVRTYIADRLSTPLIEVVTKPDLRTPEEWAVAATEIRKLCRASGRAATGAGTARQDVNVSVRGGTRVEIKGVPSIRLIPRLVHYEAVRQRALLEIRDRLRAAGLDEVPERSVDLTAAAESLQFRPVREALRFGGVVRGVVLPPPLARELDTLVGPGRPFARELADRVRVIACLDEEPNLLWHPSAEAALPSAAWQRLRRAGGLAEGEGLVLVWGPERDVRTAVTEIADRCRMALDGVPPETRQVMDDGTTGFERVLPGPDRMYPDTDLPPSPLTIDRVEAARARVPAPSWEQEAALVEAGLPAAAARAIVLDGLYEHARRGLAVPGLPPQRVGEVLVDRFRLLRRRGWMGEPLEPEVVEQVFFRLAEGALSREVLPIVLRQLSGCRRADDPDTPEGIFAQQAVPPTAEVDAAVRVVLDGPPPRSADPEARLRYWMGRVMFELGYRAPGRAVRARILAALEGR